jgi:5-methylcytosine-specific restriction enzyme subunit McrC
MKPIVVREYARLTTETVTKTLDQACISSTAFDWLCNLNASFSKAGASLLQIEGRRWLRLDSFVGVVETPCGTILEIIPKHSDDSSEEIALVSRKILCKMLTAALDLPVRTTDKTDLETFRHPLLEWVMKQFVLSLDHLIKRGLRFDYKRIEEEQRYLRGQLDINKQMRQAPGRAHIFNIRHDLFLSDRAENRLLKTALMRVCKTTQQADTWSLSHELAGRLAEIPDSIDIQSDFQQWGNSRLMAHYQPVRPWCELVLGQHMPLAVRGKTHGISLLFPMEKLFERYVEVQLRKELPASFTMKSQAHSEYLCTQNGKDIFQLRPDLLIKEGNVTRWVLDAKWKLISTSEVENKHGLSQGDFYQMYAYGQKYLCGKGEMLLIYPHISTFPIELREKPFHYSADLKLWVTSYDLENEKMHWPSTWNKTVFEPLRLIG